jgi:hypothetical protein
MDRKAVKERCKTLATKSIAASQVADIYLKDTFQKTLTVHKQPANLRKSSSLLSKMLFPLKKLRQPKIFL